MRAILALGAVCISFSSATAGTVIWSNAAGGMWTDGANWSTGSPPASVDDVVFPDLAAPYTVVVVGARSAGTVTIQSPDATIWIRGESGVHSSLTTSGLVNDGTLRLESEGAPNNSNLTINGGTLDNRGLLLVGRGSDGNRVITGNVTNTAAGTITVEDDLVVTNSGQTFHIAGGTIDQQRTLRINGGTVIYDDGDVLGQAPQIRGYSPAHQRRESHLTDFLECA